MKKGGGRKESKPIIICFFWGGVGVEVQACLSVCAWIVVNGEVGMGKKGEWSTKKSVALVAAQHYCLDWFHSELLLLLKHSSDSQETPHLGDPTNNAPLMNF